MIRDILSQLGATCTIFWASDFILWKDVMKPAYNKKIENVKSLSVFYAKATTMKVPVEPYPYDVR